MSSPREEAELSWNSKVIANLLRLNRQLSIPIQLACFISIWQWIPTLPHKIIALFGFTTFSHFILAMSVHVYANLHKHYNETFGFMESCFRFWWAFLMMCAGKIQNGYVIHGMENLPVNSGGLVVFYQSLLPLDMYFLMCELYLRRRQRLGGVAHKSSFDRGQLSAWLEFLDFSHSTCLAEDLAKGGIRAIAPGGEREALFSRNYELIWRRRIGFAKIAKRSGVPVFPMFMANGREALPFATFGFRDFFLKIYKETREFFVFPILMMPVKLDIYIGEGICCGEEERPIQFARRIRRAIEKLRDEHQRRPGNIIESIIDRFIPMEPVETVEQHES